jgi:hypothetical protein
MQETEHWCQAAGCAWNASLPCLCSQLPMSVVNPGSKTPRLLSRPMQGAGPAGRPFVEPAVTDDSGHTPLDTAVAEHRDEVARVLRGRGE